MTEIFSFFSANGDLMLAALRVALGLIFVIHGWPKLKNLKTTSANFGAMGFKPGAFWGPLVAVAECFGGLALLLGLWASPAAAVFATQFLVITIWKLLRRQPFVGGYEFDLLILAAALVILGYGAGPFSLDALRGGGF